MDRPGVSEARYDPAGNQGRGETREWPVLVGGPGDGTPVVVSGLSYHRWADFTVDREARDAREVMYGAVKMQVVKGQVAIIFHVTENESMTERMRLCQRALLDAAWAHVMPPPEGSDG